MSQPPTSQSDRILWLPASVLGVLVVIANAFGVPHLWGMNFLKFYSPVVTYSILGLIVLAFVPPVHRRVAALLDNLSRSLNQSVSARLRFGIIGIVFFIVLAVLNYQSIPLLGDGSLRAGEVYDFEWWQPTEFLDQLIHAVAYKLIFYPLSLKPTICYRVISIIAGVFFFWGAWRFVRYLMPEQNLTAFAAMATTGMAALFFGYVESYSILAAMLPWAMLSGVRAIDGTRPLWRFSLWVVLAILVHSVALFILVLPLAMTVVERKTGDYEPRRKFIQLGLMLIVVGTIGWYGFQAAGINPAGRFLLPLFGREDYQQGLLTWRHAMNLVNWLYLSALPFLFLLPLWRRAGAEPDWRNGSRRRLALTLTVSSGWFLLFFNPQLGGPRDWDLFSLPTFALVPAALIWISVTPRAKRLPRLLIPVVVVSLCVTLSFVRVNASVEKTVDRYVEAIEVAKFKNLWVEYGELYQYATLREDLADRRLQFALRGWRQPPRNRGESLQVLTKIAESYMDRDQRKKARTYIDRATSIDSLDIDNYLLLLKYFNKYGTKEDVRRVAEQIEQVQPDSARALREAGVTFLKLGFKDRGRHSLEAALAIDPNDYLSLLNLGSYHLTISGDFEQAVDYLSRAVLEEPKEFDANFYLAMAFERVGKLSRSRQYLRKSERLASTSIQQEAVKTLKRRLRTR